MSLPSALRPHRWWWIVLGAGALLLRAVWAPQAVEAHYSRLFFPALRRVIDPVLSVVPFPVVYLLVGLLILLIYRLIRRLRRTAGVLPKLGQLGYSLTAFAGAVAFLFLVLWGYNYKRLPVERSMDLRPKPLGLVPLRAELDTITALMQTARAEIPAATDSALVDSFDPDSLLLTVRAALERQLALYEFPVAGRVQGRLLHPRGILLRFSTAGVYLPWTGEGHIDAGLHPLQQPYVLAHELAHGYGFTDEGTCNFWAFLTLTAHEDPLLRYLGYFGYWRTLAGNYRRSARDDYRAFYRQAVAPGVKADLAAIYTEMDKYPDILPTVRDAVYDNYLKAQGIEEGLKNYSRVIMLVHAWRKEQMKT